jgi:hypothetical protein
MDISNQPLNLIPCQELKRFCMKCGKKLRKHYVDMRYNLKTGKQEFNIIWHCSEKKWWNGHTKMKSDEYGDTYVFETLKFKL